MHGQVPPTNLTSTPLLEILRLQSLLRGLRRTRQPRSALGTARVEPQLAMSIQPCS
jgi:hypothetical protein